VQHEDTLVFDVLAAKDVKHPRVFGVCLVLKGDIEELAGCVYRKPHPALIYVLAGEIPYSCARIPCTAEIISYFVD
jgi:hypothetical protein